MGEPTFAELFRDAFAHRAAEAEMDLDTAREMVADWLEDIRLALIRNGPLGRHATAMRVLERSFGGVLQAVRRPLPPPPAGERWADRLNRKVGHQLLPPQPPPEPATVHVDGPALVQQLLATAEAVDALLEDAVAPEPVRETLPWADDQELLTRLWLLLSALPTEDGDEALRQLRQLRQELHLHHDIEMRVADATTATAEHFDLHPGDEDHHVTVTPALLVRGNLWKRGEARIPKGDGVATHGPRTVPDPGATG